MELFTLSRWNWNSERSFENTSQTHAIPLFKNLWSSSFISQRKPQLFSWSVISLQGPGAPRLCPYLRFSLLTFSAPAPLNLLFFKHFQHVPWDLSTDFFMLVCSFLRYLHGLVRHVLKCYLSNDTYSNWPI